MFIRYKYTITIKGQYNVVQVFKEKVMKITYL